MWTQAWRRLNKKGRDEGVVKKRWFIRSRCLSYKTDRIILMLIELARPWKFRELSLEQLWRMWVTVRLFSGITSTTHMHHNYLYSSRRSARWPSLRTWPRKLRLRRWRRERRPPRSPTPWRWEQAAMSIYRRTRSSPRELREDEGPHVKRIVSYHLKLCGEWIVRNIFVTNQRSP